MISILGNPRRPDIKFFRSGKIDISSHVSKLLRLERGDIIDILAHRGEYYLVVRTKSSKVLGRHEAQCLPTTKSPGCHHFRVYSKKLSNAILSLTHSDVAHLPCGESLYIEPYGVAIPIITKINLI